VGYPADLYGSFGFTVIEHWDGSSWSVVPSSDAPDGGFLAAVAGRRTLTRPGTVAAVDAWAVGGAADGVLTEHLHALSGTKGAMLRPVSHRASRATSAAATRTCSGQVSALPVVPGPRGLERLRFSFSCNRPLTAARGGVLRLTVAGAPTILDSVARSPNGSWTCRSVAPALVCAYDGTDAPASVTELSVTVPTAQVCRSAVASENAALVDIADNGAGAGSTDVSYQLPCGSSSLVARSVSPARFAVPLVTTAVFASADATTTMLVGQAGRGILSFEWQCGTRLDLVRRFDPAHPLAIAADGGFAYDGPALVNGGRSVTTLHVAGRFVDAANATGTTSASGCGKSSFSLAPAVHVLPPRVPQLPLP